MNRGGETRKSAASIEAKENDKEERIQRRSPHEKSHSLETCLNDCYRIVLHVSVWKLQRTSVLLETDDHGSLAYSHRYSLFHHDDLIARLNNWGPLDLLIVIYWTDLPRKSEPPVSCSKTRQQNNLCACYTMFCSTWGNIYIPNKNNGFAQLSWFNFSKFAVAHVLLAFISNRILYQRWLLFFPWPCTD